ARVALHAAFEREALEAAVGAREREADEPRDLRRGRARPLAHDVEEPVVEAREGRRAGARGRREAARPVEGRLFPQEPEAREIAQVIVRDAALDARAVAQLRR